MNKIKLEKSNLITLDYIDIKSNTEFSSEFSIETEEGEYLDFKIIGKGNLNNLFDKNLGQSLEESLNNEYFEIILDKDYSLEFDNNGNLKPIIIANVKIQVFGKHYLNGIFKIEIIEW